MTKSLTHLDDKGTVKMVDVSAKDSSDRLAVATGKVIMQAETIKLIQNALNKKGDVLVVAKIAGIQAAKSCSQLIPLCHPLMLSAIDLDLKLNLANNWVEISCSCHLNAKTGVEMEALTAVSVAALTVYDMCKATDRSMIINDIKLLSKQGGKSGDYFAG